MPSRSWWGRRVFIVTAEEMRAAEQWCEAHGITTEVLMDRAGRAVAEAVLALLAERPGPVVVVVGPGNNGGDGLVAAERLARAGVPVTVAHVPRKLDPDHPLRAAREAPLRLIGLGLPGGPDELRLALRDAVVVVDALLGTGVSRPLSGLVADAARCLAGRPRESRLVAVDLPSGLQSESGAVDPLTPRADLTLTLGAPKVGCYLPPGQRYVGELRVADIGIPREAFAGVRRQALTAEHAAALLPERPVDGHKGTFGKVLVVGGSERYLGAPLLTAAAVLRVGAGLVVLATARPAYERLAGRLLEATYLPLPTTGEGTLADTAGQVMLRAIEEEGVDAVVLGPGLGRSLAVSRLLSELLPRLTLPTLIDADGLNVLAELEQWPALLPARCVLTPHPGEAARLLRSSVRAVEQDRLAAAAALTHGRAVVVLKGAHTIVQQPDGALALFPLANPALGSGGTGDVLSGLIGGLLAQGLAPAAAAALGVYLHAAAAQRWSRAHGDAGLLASDLLAEIPAVRRELRQRRQQERGAPAEPAPTA
ncbi:MAG: bifunctional NAD(P)H-hydrate repair enzyme Nnr [Dehalococcoidia bacterium]|nr:MAG: bifunctional NAD(P)H-hydrate repair enzyme Nnr [Dehalococcoidia bacterium]